MDKPKGRNNFIIKMQFENTVIDMYFSGKNSQLHNISVRTPDSCTFVNEQKNASKVSGIPDLFNQIIDEARRKYDK